MFGPKPDQPPEQFLVEDNQDWFLQPQESPFQEIEGPSEVTQLDTNITQAQKKIILVTGLGAMGLFAIIFIVAIVTKKRRKAMEKARDAIIVETSLLPISDKKATGHDEEKGIFVFENEKDFVLSDDKKTLDDASIPVMVHSYTSEKDLKN